MRSVLSKRVIGILGIPQVLRIAGFERFPGHRASSLSSLCSGCQQIDPSSPDFGRLDPSKSIHGHPASLSDRTHRYPRNPSGTRRVPTIPVNHPKTPVVLLFGSTPEIYPDIGIDSMQFM